MHKKALIAGIGAIFCWSLMVGFLRLTTVNYGSELGIALIYTLGAVFLFLLDKPTPFKKIPRRYLLIGGVLFATYELFMAFAVGLAQDSFQAIEVSILNYLWPTLTVFVLGCCSQVRTRSSSVSGYSRGDFCYSWHRARSGWIKPFGRRTILHRQLVALSSCDQRIDHLGHLFGRNAAMGLR